MIRFAILISAFALALMLGVRFPKAQDAIVVRITRQPSIIYMPTGIMEKRGLIEKQAAALGVPNVKVEWITLSGGGAATDALLSGSVDIVNTGAGNLLLLWDRTNGNVKGIVATSALPLVLVTRNPRIKTLKDYQASDKIAVPTVKVSTQALLLQLACRKTFGEDQASKLDGNTVQLGHPDAAIALTNANHEVTSHFSAPPFIYQTLKSVPGAHVVTTSADIIGSPLTVAVLFTTAKFADANPKILQAVKAAADEASALISADPRTAVDVYRTVTGDRASNNDLLEMLKQPGMMAFETQPQGTMILADHLYKMGTIKKKPSKWQDYFFPVAYASSGS